MSTLPSVQRVRTPEPTCTAFDGDRQLARGPHADVAMAVGAHVRARPHAAVLIFDDTTGHQIDFDLRGTEQEIAARAVLQFSAADAPATRGVGRPKLGVVSREVTLLPRHWEWLAAQPGGASVTLRKLVDDARRTPNDKASLRAAQERSYRFMSAMAGNRPHFEEASRALFANDMARLHELTAQWPGDITAHVRRLLDVELL